MSLGSTTCWGQRHGVGTGGERGTERGGNGRDRQGRQGMYKERRKGGRTETKGQTEKGREKTTVGGER